MDIAQFTQSYLLFVVLPLWVAAGFADWLCHRFSRIELTTGPRETAIHLLMLGEAAIPVLLALFFEITGLVLLAMFIFWLLHEATSYWDVSYAARHRQVTPIEQRVHDYLAVVPFLAMSLVFVLHWPQVLALIGLGSEPADLSLRWKEPPLPISYVAGFLGAITLFEVLPFLEELWRGLRVRRQAHGQSLERSRAASGGLRR